MSAIDHQQQALKQLRGALHSLEKAQRLGADVELERAAADVLAKAVALQVRRARMARLEGRAA